MNRQLKIVFSRSIQPTQTPAHIPVQTPAQFNSNNKSFQPTLYTRSARSVRSARSPQYNSMFNISNKSCGCG